jgi:hypothetical protein
MDKAEAKMIAEELAKLTRSTTPGTAPGGFPTEKLGNFGNALDVAAGKASPLGSALDFAKTAASKAADGLSYIKQAAEEGLGAFRELSKTGASFSNDIIGMTVASKGMRLNLEEFTDVMKNNAANFAGFGGSVTRGAEAFAKLSSEFMDSPFIDSLNQAGYQNKELNEVLALQVGFMRSSMRNDDASRKQAIESAGRLAGEMDLMAKLTGKTREEQADAMKKAQSDMQIESKMRLIGLQQGADAEKAARAAFAEQYNQAQLRGQGQMFKEVFATGTVTSQEAKMQTALLGKEAQATTNQALATAKGNVEEARKFNQIAQEEALKNNKNQALMVIGTYGDIGGAATKTVHETMKAQQTMHDAAESIRKEAAFKGKGEAEILAEASKRIKEAAAGKDAEGKEVSGATKSMINLGNRAKDAEAALYENLVNPLNKKIGPALGQFADKTLGRDVVVKGGSDMTYRQAVGTEIKRGMEGVPAAEQSGRGAYYDRFVAGKDRAASPILGGDAIRDAAKIINTGADTLLTGIEKFNASQAKESTRDSGTLGMTGSLFESQDFYGKVAKGETVMTPKQLEGLIQGTTASGIMSGIQSSSQKNNTALDTKGLFSGLSGAINSAAQKNNTAPVPEKLFSEVFNSGASSSIKDMQQLTTSVMDQQKKASNFQGGMDMLKTSQVEDKFKKIGSTEGAEAEARARAKFNEQTAQSQSAKDDKAKTIQVKDASLNDVVASLNKLNIKIAQLNDNLVDVGSKQIRAVKSNSKNLYERA